MAMHGINMPAGSGSVIDNAHSTSRTLANSSRLNTTPPPVDQSLACGDCTAMAASSCNDAVPNSDCRAS